MQLGETGNKRARSKNKTQNRIRPFYAYLSTLLERSAQSVSGKIVK